jgi:RimJ/RimL family protein N-acetyltransferase
MAFDLQPTLLGERVHLRPLHESDFDALFAVSSDPLIWEQHPCNDRYLEPVFREFFREGIASGGAFLVLDARDGCVIGSTRFARYNEETSQIEIGWTFLARSHWGGTYNQEMKRLLLRHAFQFVNSVVLQVGVGNIRSRTAVERIGGLFEEVRIDEAGREHAIYRIKREPAS